MSKKTGLIQGIRFETSPSDDFYPSVVKHIKMNIDRHNDGNYYNGNTLATPIFDSMHIKAGVQTWNHLSCLLSTDNRAGYSQLLQAPLKYLTGDEFSEYKFVRKSQGEHFTKEDKTNLYLYSFILILGALATLWWPPLIPRKGETLKG